MKKLYIPILTSIFISALFTAAFSQDYGKIIKISNSVGQEIDKNEKIKYSLFNEYDNETFKEVIFYRNKDRSFTAVISFLDGSTEKKDLSEFEFSAIKMNIEKEKINYEQLDSSKNCVIKMIDESSYSGHVISVSETEINLRTKYLGVIRIPKKNIKEIVVLDNEGKIGKKYWLPNPHGSRHYFAPTARNMKKGEGYFQDIYLLILNANYGLTDYLTVGAGCSIIPGMGIDEQGYLLNAKLGFDITDKFSLGGGVLFGSIPVNHVKDTVVSVTYPILYTDPVRDTTFFDSTETQYSDRINAGLGFAVATYGTKENNITFGMGYVLAEGYDFKNPIYMLGGMLRMSRRTAFVSENWLFFEDHEDGTFAAPIISYGVRFFGEKMSLDFAFLQMPGEKWIDELIFPGIPYVDFVIKF